MKHRKHSQPPFIGVGSWDFRGASPWGHEAPHVTISVPSWAASPTHVRHPPPPAASVWLSPSSFRFPEGFGKTGEIRSAFLTHDPSPLVRRRRCVGAGGGVSSLHPV